MRGDGVSELEECAGEVHFVACAGRKHEARLTSYKPAWRSAWLVRPSTDLGCWDGAEQHEQHRNGDARGDDAT